MSVVTFHRSWRTIKFCKIIILFSTASFDAGYDAETSYIWMDNIGQILTLKILRLCRFCHLSKPLKRSLDSNSSSERKKQKNKVNQLPQPFFTQQVHLTAAAADFPEGGGDFTSPKSRFHPDVFDTCRQNHQTRSHGVVTSQFPQIRFLTLHIAPNESSKRFNLSAKIYTKSSIKHLI